MTDNLSQLRRLTDAVRTAGVDIAPSYSEYIQLAFAIATDCGEAGRSDFLTLCSLSAKYDPRAADKLFTSALKTHKNDVHLGTVFHLAQLCGVTAEYRGQDEKAKGAADALNAPPSSHTQARAYNNVKPAPSPSIDDENGGSEEATPGSEPSTPLPTFGEDTAWPRFLRRIMQYGDSPAQRDVLLLGAITVLGSSMSRYVCCPYSGRMMSPCLQTFVVALSAAGKGVLTLVRLLVEPIHNEIRSQVEGEMKQYLLDKAAYDALGKDRSKATLPVRPLNRMFLISGNNTGTGILQNIIDSNGFGLICESEADTLSTAIGSEYGHWSDTMRKAFDQDRLSYNRRTDQEYREVKKMYVSVLISGTPAQVKPLIPTAENGLFSRQIFYYMPAIRQWKSQFDREDADLERVFTAWGMEWKGKLQELSKSGLFVLRLTAAQKEEFNRVFTRLFLRSGMANGDEMSSSIARLAINLCRIMQVVAMLRVMETVSGSSSLSSSPHVRPDAGIPSDNLKDGIVTRWDMSITEADFRAVLALAEKLYRHTIHILSFLPTTEVTRRSNADRDALLQCMGMEFTRAEFLQKGEEMGIKTSTAISWLKRMTKRGVIISVDGNGIYRKSVVTEI